MAPWSKIHLPMQETRVRSLGGKDPLEKETHSSILAWNIPWTGESGRLQSRGLQRVRHDEHTHYTHTHTHTHTHTQTEIPNGEWASFMLGNNGARHTRLLSYLSFLNLQNIIILNYF